MRIGESREKYSRIKPDQELQRILKSKRSFSTEIQDYPGIFYQADILGAEYDALWDHLEALRELQAIHTPEDARQYALGWARMVLNSDHSSVSHPELDALREHVLSETRRILKEIGQGE